MADGSVLVDLGQFSEGLAGALAKVLPDERFVVWPTSDGTRPDDAEIVLTIGGDRSTTAAALAPSVQWVHVLGAGVDGLPLETVGERPLTCSRGAAAPAIAEFVLATMLAFEKQLPESWAPRPPDEWNQASLGGLSGRTVGVIGLGSIGTEVARRALAFDLHVLAVRRRPSPAPLEGVEMVASLNELLGRSDHVVVATPATPETHHLIDTAAFAALKPGAHLMNVARGSVVDPDALLVALDDGTVARASLDVTEPEPLPADHPLAQHPRVRISPHISWSSPDTMRRTIAMFVDNVRRYRAGDALHGVVDTAAGY